MNSVTVTVIPKQGNYHNPRTGESLRDDMKHKDPIGPHWDYKPGPHQPWYRWFPNGKIAPKSVGGMQEA